MIEDISRGMVLTMLIVAMLFIAQALLSGCAPSQAQLRAQGAHEVLNTVTDIANPSYDLAIELCDARELVIIQRQGTTREQDRADFAATREICDRVFQGFRALRELQLASRAAIAAVIEKPDDALWAAAIATLRSVSARWTEIQALLHEAGLVRRSE